MARYYYNRYYASYHQDYTTEYYYSRSSTTTIDSKDWGYLTSITVPQNSFSFNESSGHYSTTSVQDVKLSSPGNSASEYSASPQTTLKTTKYTILNNAYYNLSHLEEHSIQESRQVPSGGYYYQGSFIDTLIAEDGTYPNNGRVGSYWYVKGAKVTNMSVNIGGTWKEADPYVLVNGVWKTVDVSTNIAGTWRS